MQQIEVTTVVYILLSHLCCIGMLHIVIFMMGIVYQVVQLETVKKGVVRP